MVSGALTSLSVKKEVTYKTDPGTTYSGIFGHGTKLSSLSKSNTVERIYGIGSRTQQVNLEKQFVPSFLLYYFLYYL